MLLYLQDTDGNEEWHLYRVDLDDPDAPAVDLTPLDPGSRVFAVDPETTVPGTVIAWMNPRPLYIDVFRIDLATGERTPLVERTDPTEFFLLDRTGRPTWYLSKDIDGTHEIFAVDPDTGCAAPLHRVGGPEHPMGVFFVPLPDGSGALLGDYQDSDDLRLVRLDRETGERTVVAAVDGHSLDTLSAASDTLPPTVFASRRTGEVIAARFTGDRPRIVPIDPHFADVADRAGEALRRRPGLGDLRPGASSAGSPLSSTTANRDTTWFYDHSTGDARLLGRDKPRPRPGRLSRR